MQNNFDVSPVMSKSWEIFKENWEKLTLFYFGMMLLVGALTLIAPCQPPTGNDPEANLEWMMNGATIYYLYTLLVPGVVQLVMLAFFFKKVLSIAKNVDIELTTSTLLRVIVTSVIVAIASYAALLCCFIPFIFIAPRLFIAPIYVIDNPNISVGEAIERSWNATKGNVGILIALYFVSVIVIILGVFCCLVGVLPATVFSYVMMVVIYLFLSGQNGGDYEEVKQDGETPQEESFVIEEKTVCRD